MGPLTSSPPAQLPCMTLLVDEAAILAYARLTHDFNPIHVDEKFAATTPFGKPIAHGMLSLNLIWQSLRAALGMRLPISLEIRFLRPVFRDSTITAGGTRRADGAGYHVWVRDEAGTEVMAGVASLAGTEGCHGGD
jgi:3-hydroxybutyryl-CoA dehydratase